MNVALVLTMLFAQFKGQERSVIVSTIKGLLSGENTRVNAGLDDGKIDCTAQSIADLVLGEENQLLNQLTKKLSNGGVCCWSGNFDGAPCPGFG